MKILVDTQIFLWAISNSPKLSVRLRNHYLDEANELYLSMASVWEMIIKFRLGKLPLPSPATAYIQKQMERNRLGALPIRNAHLAELETLPALHRDPFDRMLIAQARAENWPILSADPQFKRYNVKVLR